MRAEAVQVVVHFDPGRLTKNHHLHWRARAKLVKMARTAAWLDWQSAGSPSFDVPVDVRVTIRRGRKLDPLNAANAIDPIVDGIFCRNRPGNDGGIVPDDSAKWVRFVSIDQETGKQWIGREEVEFTIQPRQE